MWVQLLAGPPALESLVKVSSKIGAPTLGEYSEAIEPVLALFFIFFSLGRHCDCKASCCVPMLTCGRPFTLKRVVVQQVAEQWALHRRLCQTWLYIIAAHHTMRSWSGWICSKWRVGKRCVHQHTNPQLAPRQLLDRKLIRHYIC